MNIKISKIKEYGKIINCDCLRHNRNLKIWLESKWCRFILLIGAAGLGLLVGPCIGSYLIGTFKLEGHLATYFKPFAVSSFVIILLWVFRTHDTLQKIYQGDLFKGLDDLASDSPLKVDIGVAILIEISKKVPAFRETIKMAFIRRLKTIPCNRGEAGSRPLMSYAQHIIRWLIEYRKENANTQLKLNGMNLSSQEFTVGKNGEGIVFSKLINEEVLLSLCCTDVSGINFSGLKAMTLDKNAQKSNSEIDLERDAETINEALKGDSAKNLRIEFKPKSK